MKIYSILFLVCVYPLNASGQIGNTIPIEKRVDWTQVGYQRNPIDNLPIGSFTTIYVGSPNNNPTLNVENINYAIEQASNHGATSNYVVIKFDSGTYIIDEEIKIKPINNYIIFRGEGIRQTYIKKSEDSSSSTIFNIQGKALIDTFHVNSYNSQENSITLKNETSNLEAGDFIDIQVVNGSWHNSEHSQEHDLLGHIIKIKSKKNNSEYILEDNFSFVWNLANSEDKQTYFRKLNLVHNIGFEKITLKPLNKKAGNIFSLDYTKDIWFRDLETKNAVNSHFQVSHSTQIELRRNYIHHAQNYGTGGHGYGIELIRRTTNSLVEDNIFQSLRHAMILARGANRNVFGYNYSREQKDSVGNILSDINLHGNFPFLNLIEGNRVDRIKADSYHGSNGYYNTLVRNYSYYQSIEVKISNKFNLIGNEAKLILNTTTGHLDEYSNKKSHVNWNPSDFTKSVHNDVSYYHTTQPAFLNNYNWPPIGPRESITSEIKKHNIPARDRFCNENPTTCDNTIININSGIAFYRARGDSNRKQNRIYFYPSDGSEFSYLTDFSMGGYDYKGITSGDFNGDGIDDIAFYRANGDNDRTENRIYAYTSDGNEFSHLTNFSMGEYDFKGITSGDFNGDGIDDIAFYRANGVSDSTENRIYIYTSDGSQFSYLTDFSMGGYDFKGITSGDFNGDGIDDIAFYRANGDNDRTENSIYIYTSDGSEFSHLTNFSMGEYDFKGITSGDFNGDGIDDIAFYRANGVSDSTENRIFFYTSDGSQFSYLTDFSMGEYDYKGITSGDFNGDGIDDIAFYRARGDHNPKQSRIYFYTSDGSQFSYLTDFSMGGYDFKGITSGRYSNLE